MSSNKTNQDESENRSSVSKSDANKPTWEEKRKGKSMEACMGESLDKLSTAFMDSARRWEMIVYPSLVAFIILAVYGFFLIYSLTKDVHLVVQDMHKITTSMERMVVNMDVVSKNMVVMTQTVDAQSASMREMVYHVRGMNMSMNQMRYDMSNVSRPMSFMNDFLPW
ncbi:MAG: hypothetical protein KAT06_08515 [Gammaproteobacteria bacterium]|nr:hypothetical protein [Gammaproteobacteria bacterium]